MAAETGMKLTFAVENACFGEQETCFVRRFGGRTASFEKGDLSCLLSPGRTSSLPRVLATSLPTHLPRLEQERG